MASLCGQSLMERIDTLLTNTQDTSQVEKLSDLILEMVNRGDIVSDTLFEKVLATAHKQNDFWSLSTIYLNRSVYDLNTGETAKGLVNIEEGIKYARISKKDFLLSECYSIKMQLLMAGGRTQESAELASAKVKEYHASGNFYYEAGTYQILSLISSSLGDYELTLKYDSIALLLSRKSEYVDILVTSLHSASSNLTFLGYPEKGLAFAEEALKVAKEKDLEYEFGNILNARAEANTALGNYSEALKDYEVLKDLEGEQQFTWWMASRSILLQRIGRHEESRDLMLEAIGIIKETSNNPLELKRSYQAMQTVGLDQAQYDTVSFYRELMDVQQDSLQAAENIRNLLELEEKYRAQEKADKILKQEKELSLRNIQFYLLVGCLVIALFTGFGFFYLSERLKKRNAENEQLVMDKEVLIGEIHHRVKNNLQVVSSLLQIQRRGLDSGDDKGREALLESQNRVSAMGLIHNKLYQGEEVTSVHMPDYLEDLGETLLDAYRLEEQVEIFYDIEDLRLEVDRAIPLGLIINELVTNSLKYAFPNGREGTIGVYLRQEENQLRLEVNDNGVGAAAAEKRADSTSFGASLVGLLAKKLKGELRILKGKGYGIEILFDR